MSNDNIIEIPKLATEYDVQSMVKTLSWWTPPTNREMRVTGGDMAVVLRVAAAIVEMPLPDFRRAVQESNEAMAECMLSICTAHDTLSLWQSLINCARQRLKEAGLKES